MVALLMTIVAACGNKGFAHPLGNFTINHFSKIQVGHGRVQIHGVIDMAEIPTFQELQAIDTNGDGQTSEAELSRFVSLTAAPLAEQMILIVDGERVPLTVVAQKAKLPLGAGGLPTLRIELDLEGRFSANNEVRSLTFEDRNYSDRIGWREIVVVPTSGLTIFNSTAYASGLSDELRSYPEGLLAAPLDERSAQLSFSSGAVPVDVRPLSTRAGRFAQAPARDRLAELISVPQLTPGLVLAGLLFAMILGAMHALSPGHGKTVVGAYLVGSRGTARHAAFLGLTVTITHTAGVFALGLITLLASEYVVPERLFPILSLLSGGLVAAIGLSLFFRRLRGAVFSSGIAEHDHDHDDGHHHRGSDPSLPHSHGGRIHSHLPPGTDGSRVTWKSLLALGISGGILPCPSALVVLLAAISLHRVGYGLLLVFFFSIGLAGVLTAVGLIFVYAKRLLKSAGAFGRLAKVLPIASAFVISCAGIAICYQALSQSGIDLFSSAAATWSRLSSAAAAPQFASIGGLGILGLGLIYGLKHATEADHIVAVSTIVSEHRRLGRAAVVGALWGVGHTASLVVVGTIVLAFKVAVPESVASWLEFAVALMIISLGAIAFRRALNRRSTFHVHRHDHSGLDAHSHIHFHESNAAENAGTHSHDLIRIGIKPTIVGAVHGFAGSAALTLLVLTQISSPVLGLLYLGVFGAGSILGMLLMSGLVGLPFVLGSRKLNGIHYSLQMIAGAMSITFGFWYAYITGFASGLIG